MRPVYRWAAVVLAGSATGMAGAGSSLAWLAATFAAVAVVAVLTRRDHARAGVGFALFTLAAAHAAAVRQQTLHASLSDALGQLGGPVRVEGRLVDDAGVDQDGVRLLVDVATVVEERHRLALTGRAELFVQGDGAARESDTWRGGRTIRAWAALHPPAFWLNPGGASVEWQALQRPFQAAGTIKSAALIDVSTGRWWDEAAANVRSYVRSTVRGWTSSDDPGIGPVLLAFLIGDRSGLDRDTITRLQRAGTYHVIAISGGNVALVVGLMLVLFRPGLRSHRTLFLALISVVAAYGWVVGGDPSVSRAVTAAVVYFSFGLFGLVASALEVFALVAAVNVLVDPATIVQPSAWLSFGATLGIVLWASRFSTWLTRGSAQVRSRRVRALVRAAGTLAAATCAAELALLPVGAAEFFRVSVAGLVMNFVAIPVMAIVQSASVIALILAPLSTSVGRWIAMPARIGAVVLLRSAAVVDIWPWLSWRVPPPSALLAIGFYVAVLMAASSRRSGRPWRQRTVVAIAAALGVLVATEPFGTGHPPAAGWLRLTAMDVGQGDALLLQLPSGPSLLVDAGPAGSTFDAGDRIVMPTAWSLGVRRLTWLAVTHADNDHIGGAPAAAAEFRPQEIWEGPSVLSDPGRQRLIGVAGTIGAGWRQVQTGDALTIGAVRLDVLSPHAPDWQRRRVQNDDSVVLRVRYGDAELLLTGDIGTAPEADILDEEGPVLPPIRVLKIAHHGSRTSTSPGFLDRYRPNVAIASAGRSNPFGHPAPQVLDRLAAVGARVFRTDQDGAVVVETNGSELRVQTMTGRDWHMRVLRE